MAPIESALIVAVPQAEAAVKRFRDDHDPSAAVGVPAHVTVLYPFRQPHDIGASVHATLQQCFAMHMSFRFTLATTRRFPGVLYIAPEPDGPFRRLTQAVWQQYPETPPYGGKYPAIVPHLTVAQVADEKELDAIADTFARASRTMLPISAVATEVTLMDNRSGRWQERARFPLGGG